MRSPIGFRAHHEVLQKHSASAPPARFVPLGRNDRAHKHVFVYTENTQSGCDGVLSQLEKRQFSGLLQIVSDLELSRFWQEQARVKCV